MSRSTKKELEAKETRGAQQKEKEQGSQEQDGQSTLQLMESMQQQFLVMFQMQSDGQEKRREQEREETRLQMEQAREERQMQREQDRDDRLRLLDVEERKRQEEKQERKELELLRVQQEEKRIRERQARDAPPMARMSLNTDIEDFIELFESHMATKDLPRKTWIAHLRPILNDKCRDVLWSLSPGSRDDYATVRGELLDKCGVRQARQADLFWNYQRQKGQSYAEMGRKVKRMITRVYAPATTVEEAADIIAIEKIIQSLPVQAATYVRDRRPKTTFEACDLADQFFTDRKTSPDHPSWSRSTRPEKKDNYTHQKPPWHSQEQTWTNTQGKPKTGDADGTEDKSTSVTRRDTNYGPRRPDDNWMKRQTCYACNKIGHLSYTCPTRVNIVYNPAVETGQAVLEGAIEGRQFNDLVLDSGAQMTVIREDAIPTECFTGKTMTAKGFGSTVQRCKTAIVDLEVGPYQDRVEVLAAPPEYLSHTALLGCDIPFFWTIMQSYAKQVDEVRTRSQSKKMVEQQKKDDEASATSGASPIRLEDLPDLHDLLTDDLEVADNTDPEEADKEDEEMDPTLQRMDQAMFLPDREPKKKTDPRVEERKHKANQHDLGTVDRDTLIQAQEEDPTLAGPRRESDCDAADSHYLREDGILYRCSQTDLGEDTTLIVVPEKYRRRIFEKAHSHPLSGHLGKRRTIKKIVKHFHWENITTDISNWCKECPHCQRGNKTKKQRAPLMPLPTIEEPFERVAVDLVGPLRRTKHGHKYILTLMDFATRYPEAIPLRKTDAKTVAEALVTIFTKTGIPKEVLSDRGSNFMSTVMQQTFAMLGVTHITTSPYHPQTNGMLERFHSTLKAMLRKTTGVADRWDEYLPYLCFAYRDTPHATLGFSPFELLYGRDVRGPLSIVRQQWAKKKTQSRSIVEFVQDMQKKLEEVSTLARDREEKTKAKVKTWYDQKARERNFEVGDQVLVLLPEDHCKTTAEWHGPYTVIRKASNVSYVIELPEKRQKLRQFHVNMLKKWIQAKQIATVLVADEEDMDQLAELPILTLEMTRNNTQPVIRAGLPPEQKKQLLEFLDSNADLFTPEPGSTDTLEHTIPTGESPPTSQHPYRVPVAWQSAVREEVQKLLTLGIIKPSTSPWAAPIVTVRKKDGSLRMCVDYRKLNSVTSPDTYNMPRVEELIDNLSEANYITTLDLTKGYYQVPVRKCDQPKTAFVTPQGKFEFTKMPFGLRGAPSTFQRLMDTILTGAEDFSAAYIDDVIIYSRTWTEHLDHLQAVFQRLRQAGLTLKQEKCQFAMATCSYLGHIVGNGHVQPELGKVKAVRDFATPKSKKDIRAFLGLVGYYRRFIPRFAEQSACLSDLTKQREPEKPTWKDHHQEAFEHLKAALETKPMLACPLKDQQFELHTDASQRGVGAVLCQRTEDDQERPVAYYSRKLLPRETRYSTVEKECLAIVNSIKHFSIYLLGQHFTIITDHGALRFLQTMRNGNGRLTRWAMALQPYHFTILHRPGADHGNADGLSRQSWPEFVTLPLEEEGDGQDLEKEDTNLRPKEGEGGVRDPSHSSYQDQSPVLKGLKIDHSQETSTIVTL